MQNNRWYNYFAVIVLVLLGIWLWRRGQQAEDNLTADNQDEQIASRADDFLSDSGFTLPENATRVNLSDPTGGTNTGIATRDEDMNYTVLASLPKPETGWYQAWLTSQDNADPVSLGTLSLAKGGYLLETRSSVDQEVYIGVMVTREQVRDTSPETTVLKGQF